MSDPSPPSTEGPALVIPPNAYQVQISTIESIEAARHRRWRETILFGTALAMFVAVLLVSLWFAFLAAGSDPETRKAAIGIVVTLIGALGGFLGGRATK